MRMAVLPDLTQRKLKFVPEAAAGKSRFETMLQPVAAPSAGLLETTIAFQAVPLFVDHSTAKVALVVALSLR